MATGHCHRIGWAGAFRSVRGVAAACAVVKTVNVRDVVATMSCEAAPPSLHRSNSRPDCGDANEIRCLEFTMAWNGAGAVAVASSKETLRPVGDDASVIVTVAGWIAILIARASPSLSVAVNVNRKR